MRPQTVICALVLSLWPLRAQLQPAPQGGATPPLAITRVGVIDATGAPLKPGMTVLVENGRISRVGPADEVVLPAGAATVDGSGKYLIPGLWDMHVHWYDQRFLDLFIANGVTGVRQMWGMPLHLDWRSRIARGELLGPRFSIASAIVDGPSPVWPGSLIVEGPEDAARVVGAIAQGGYDFVKVYNRLSRDAYFAVAAAARRQGLPFCGHVPESVSALEASDAGQKSIEHLDGVLYAASRDGERLRARRAELGGKTNAVTGVEAATREALRALRREMLATYDDVAAAALFDRFAKNGTWQVPTLTVLRSMASLDDSSFTSDPRLKYMPRSIRESWNPANDGRIATKTAGDYALDRQIVRKQIAIVGAMRKSGVRLLAGPMCSTRSCFPGSACTTSSGCWSRPA